MERNNRMDREARQALTEKVEAIIDRFLHREAIREDDRRVWVAEAVGRFGEVALWHAARAGGFGGSEVGVLVRNHMGFRADHGASAHDIVEGKLLRRLPEEETGDLRRGHKFEPMVAEFFCEKHGARRHEEFFKRLQSTTGVRVWMRYSPDDLVAMPGRSGDRILLVDYKCPRTVDPLDAVAFQYSCQLHQGAMICHKAGIKLDGMVLVQFDWAGCDTKEDYIPYDSDLAETLVRAGDHYWEWVLRGEVPPYIFKPKLVEEKILGDADVQALARKYASVAAMASALDAKRELLAERLKERLGGTRLENAKLQFPELTISAAQVLDQKAALEAVPEADRQALAKKGGKKKLDAEAAIARLQELGEDVAPFVSREFDAAKLFEYLAARDIDAEKLVAEQVRMVVAKELKQEAMASVEAIWGDQVDEAEGDASQDVREGQETERHAPRTAMA